MKFWLVSRFEKPGCPAITTDDKQYIATLTQQGYKVKYMPQMGVAAINPRFKIKGRYKTTDRDEVLILMKVGGPLRFNPQDAIDEGILTYDEVRKLGFDNVVDNAPVKEPEPAPEPAPEPKKAKPLPNFDTIRKDALVAWADAQDPPIHLDRRKRKDTLVAEVKAALAERE